MLSLSTHMPAALERSGNVSRTMDWDEGRSLLEAMVFSIACAFMLVALRLLTHSPGGKEHEYGHEARWLLQLLKRRRSVFPKDFNGRPVPQDAVDLLLEAANQAPSHGNTEPWRFVVLGANVALHPACLPISTAPRGRSVVAPRGDSN